MTSVAGAQIVSNSPDSVEVAIYREDNEPPQPYGRDIRGPKRGSMDEREQFGLGMVSEQRTVQLPAGRSIVRFESVADLIVPQTAKLEGLPTPVVEGNFDYDLLGPGSLIAKSIGQSVRVVRTNRQTGAVTVQPAILRSGPQGVMLETNTGVEALGCSGLDERLIFDSLPASLADRPTLSMTVNAPQAGQYKLRLSYLTLGLSWTANYVAKLNDNKTLDLVGWITLTNRSASTFSDAPVKVIAGNLSRDRESTVPPEPITHEQSAQCWPVGRFESYRRAPYPVRLDMPMQVMNQELMSMAKSADVIVTGNFVARQSELGDYKLYTLPEKTTVAAQQTKQVKMLEKTKVAYERFYRFTFDPNRSEDEASGPRVFIRMQNRSNTGLGLPMPAGNVAVMEPTSKRQLVLAGEDRIEDVPVGLPAEIELGEAMDIAVQARVLKDETANGAQRREVEIAVGNDKPVAVRVELLFETYGQANARVVSESRPHTMKSGNPLWVITLPPGSRQVLRYTVDIAD
jgi:hypothetical protein